MAEKTKLWYLKGFNLYQELDEEALMSLDKQSRMRRSSKKEILYFPEEPSDTIYFLKEGKVKISRVSEDGRSTTLDLLGPGEIFGESAILGQETHENIAEVAEDAVICTISKDMFTELMAQSPWQDS